MTGRTIDPLQRYRLAANDRPNDPTRLELIMQWALDLMHLTYDEQGHVGRYRPDFIVTLAGRRVIIECDGPVHLLHAQRKKDAIKNGVYLAAGYEVYRFTTEDIYHSPVGCVERILTRPGGNIRHGQQMGRLSPMPGKIPLPQRRASHTGRKPAHARHR